ncbi:unnamed protein product [Arabidopsis halleri]
MVQHPSSSSPNLKISISKSEISLFHPPSLVYLLIFHRFSNFYHQFS